MINNYYEQEKRVNKVFVGGMVIGCVGGCVIGWVVALTWFLSILTV
jgi:hypothetical protein